MPPQFQQSQSIKGSVQKLMTGVVGKTRQKAIITIAKKHNMSRDEARFHQAIKIAQTQFRKGK